MDILLFKHFYYSFKLLKRVIYHPLALQKLFKILHPSHFVYVRYAKGNEPRIRESIKVISPACIKLGTDDVTHIPLNRHYPFPES